VIRQRKPIETAFAGARDQLLEAALAVVRVLGVKVEVDPKQTLI
jgi:hypothetical protein